MSAVLEAQEPSALYLGAVQPALVRHFELLATAPGGVVRLRELVYILAAGGHLAPKTDSDCMMKLGEVAEFIMGQAPPGAECNKIGEGTVFVKTGEFGVLYPEVCEWTTKPLKFAQTGDVLICVVGATIGKLNLAIDCAIGRSVAAVRPAKALHTKYLYYALMPFTLALRKGARGSAQGVIGKTDLASIELRVPPLDEQEAIVARVDELMCLCDDLEAKGRLEAEQHARLLGTLLGTLTDSSTPEELAANWQRVTEHFDLLLDRPEAVDALEQTILQLAVRGLLVPQDPSDEPATALLERIRIEKDRLMALGRMRRERPLQPIDDDEIQLDLPAGWAWVRLQEAYDVRDGTHDTPKYHDTGIPLVTSKNISSGRLDLTDVKLISAADHTAISARSRVDRNDILFAMIGSIGNPVMVDTDVEFSIKNVALFKYVSLELSNPEFLLLSLTVAAERMKARAAGAVQSFVSLGQIRSTTVALPPLAEQARIVARVNQLRQLCADLRQRLDRSRATQTALADALIDQTLAA